MARFYGYDRRHLLFLDGFEQSRNSSCMQRRYGLGPTDADAIQWILGRYGQGTALRWDGATFLTLNVVLREKDGEPPGHRAVGIAWRFSGTFSGSVPMIQFLRQGSVQCGLHAVPTVGGVLLEARRGGATALVATEEVYLPDTWYYLEFRAVIGDSATTGEVELRVDQARAFKRGANTQEILAGTEVDGIRVRVQAPTSGTADIDDWYVSAAKPPWDEPPFLGELTTTEAVLTGDSTEAPPELEPVPAGPSFENVDEAASDDDATYNRGSPPTQGDLFRDHYQLDLQDDEGITGRVRGIAVVNECREEDTALPRMRAGSTIRQRGSEVGDEGTNPFDGVPFADAAWTEVHGAFTDAPAGYPMERQDARGEIEAGPYVLWPA